MKENLLLRSSAHKRNGFVAAILLVLCFLTFSNGLRNNFVIDDYGLILADNQIHNGEFFYHQFLSLPKDYVGIKPPYVKGYYRPFAHLLPMLGYLWFKNNPFGYHLMNLVLLYCCSLVIYFFVERCFRSWQVALLTSSLFVSHPINGVLINYITASVFSAQIIFTLLCIYCAAFKEGKRWVWVSCGFFVGALFCHETAMFLPAYLLTVFVFVSKMNFREISKRSAPFIFIILGYILFRYFFASLQTSVLNKISVFNLNFFEYTASLAKLLLWYLNKLIFLNGIVLIWKTPVVRDNLIAWNFGFAAAIAFSFYLLKRWQKNTSLFLGLAWFLIGMVPVGLACFYQPTVGLMIEPHWLFLSTLGFCMVVASLCVNAQEVLGLRLGIMVFCIFLGCLIFQSRQYNSIWGNEIKYCHYWLKEAPGFKSAQFYLAGAYSRAGDRHRAKEFYTLSLEGRYTDWEIYNNLGLFDLEENELTSAYNNFMKANSLYPGNYVVLNNLAAVSLKLNQVEQAKDYFIRAINLNQFLLTPRLGLADIYLRENKIEEAIYLYQDNLNVDPNDGPTAFALINLYLKLGKDKEAADLAKQILPNNVDVQSFIAIGDLFAQRNSVELAEDFFERAIKREPHNPDAYLEFGKLLGNLEKYDEAIAIWEKGQVMSHQENPFVDLIHEVQALKGK